MLPKVSDLASMYMYLTKISTITLYYVERYMQFTHYNYYAMYLEQRWAWYLSFRVFEVCFDILWLLIVLSIFRLLFL